MTTKASKSLFKSYSFWKVQALQSFLKTKECLFEVVSCKAEFPEDPSGSPLYCLLHNTKQVTWWLDLKLSDLPTGWLVGWLVGPYYSVTWCD